MALIPCPYCGNEVSSFAKTCPHCSSDLTQMEPTMEPHDVLCPECSYLYDINLPFCPNCGEPNAAIEVQEDNEEKARPSYSTEKKKTSYKPIIIGLIFVALLISGVVIYNSITKKQEAERIEQAHLKAEAEKKAAEEKRKQQEEAEKERKRLEEERQRQREKNVLQWLQGNWEWSGTIDGYRNSCRLGVADEYAVLATPRGVLDQGYISIDFEDNTIHFGSTYIDFDYAGGRLGDFSNGMYYTKMSSSSSSHSSYSGGSTSYSSTSFNTSSEVMAYVSNRFKNSVGNVITIKYDGLYSNGNQITNAVRVVRFNGSRAVLSATSPYTQGTLYFTVDASRGTITDGSGDVFYKK